MATTPLREELAEGVWLVPLRAPTLPPATHTNCYVVGTGELVVIDPGSPYPDQQAALADFVDGLVAAGRRVREVLITHHHPDHHLGAGAFAERYRVPVAVHAATAERGVRGDRMVEDRDVLELGGSPARRVRAVLTPGHAQGHLCFVEEHTGVLFAGDMVAGVGTVVIDPPDGDMGDYLASLAALRAIGAAVLAPGHGPVVDDPAAKLDFYVAHRLEREARIVAALRAGAQGLADVVAAAYTDVPVVMHPLAARSALAHLLKLAREGRVVERDGAYRLL